MEGQRIMNDYDEIKSMDIGEIIAFFRKRKGLTQEELAKKLNYYNKNYISSIENGNASPNIKILADIAYTLDIDLAYFNLDNLTLGKKIKYLRICKGYTQLELAKRIKVNNRYLSEVEKDIITPDKEHISAIAKVLNISTKKLINFNLEPVISEDFNMFSSERIRYYRKQAELTQKELGQKIGLSGDYISLFERNKRCPDKDTLIKIAKALNKNVNDLR